MNSFRDFEKSLCILWDRACINILDPDQVSGANGILCYGYVDHAAGLTFEGLALVSCMDDDYTIVLDNDEIGMKIRADEEKVRNAVPVSNKALLARYADRIEILDIYYEDTEVVNARAMPELDPFRHPQYPDDLFVFFLAQDKHYEQMWVRCGKYLFDADGIKVFTGTLLNEPMHNPEPEHHLHGVLAPSCRRVSPMFIGRKHQQEAICIGTNAPAVDISLPG